MQNEFDNEVCNTQNKNNNTDEQQQESPKSPTRRQFLNDACALSVSGIAAGTIGASAILGTNDAYAGPLNPQPGELLSALSGKQRQQQVFNLRKQIAQDYKNELVAAHPNNGDDERYPKRVGSYTKGMVHNALGEVDTVEYNNYLMAIETGDRERLDAITTPGNITLRNIENIWSIDFLGPDSHSLTMAPAPAFASAEQAGEITELYWQALTRDIPFTEYYDHPDIQAAADNLNTMSDFRGPKDNGLVTPNTLFRGFTTDDLRGPFVSQFLLMDIPYGALLVPQRIVTSPFEQDYVTEYDNWLAQQNGMVEKIKINDPIHRYIRNGRDMGEYVGRDFLYQPYLNAALILTRLLKLPFDPNNPYINPNNPSQHGHNTFGGHHVYHLVARVANIAQKNAWYQKWAVHRRLRPEKFGGRVHNHQINTAQYDIHNDLLGNSEVLDRVYGKWNSYLLPQQYPEGVPPHPAYPAGHATIAGACATVLKAMMDEDHVLENTVIANDEGTELESWEGGASLTVGGELNKLASNISIGRDTAGVHWRSDSVEGMKLGEQIAINVLRDQRRGYYEEFDGFHLTKFDGSKIIF